MKCPECRTPNPDNARFCVGCGRLLPLQCPVCGAPNPADARFCNQCGTALQPSNSPVGETPTPGNLRTPTRDDDIALRGQLAADEDGPAEERRVVTVLFADLTSSTALAEAMDPEDVRALLSQFFTTITRELHRHGGTVEKYIGDAVMAVFGQPFVHEDDPLRAVRAALDMRAALERFNAARQSAEPTVTPLHMRIGINTGEVVAARDAVETGDFIITGDPVNVAARLQQSADPDTILVGPRTYRGTAGAVVYRALAPIDLRGKARPVRVWEALSLVEQSAAALPRPRGVRGLRAPLIGRDVELGLLRGIAARTRREHHTHLVTILGAPGVGKTRLAREFLTEATRGAEGSTPPLVLEGRCPQYGESITYWPLAEILRALANFSALDTPDVARARLRAYVTELLGSAGRGDDLEVTAAYLGYTIGVETSERRQALLPNDGRQLQDGLFRAWRVFFELVAAARDVTVLIDDIHWADDSLLDLLEYVAAHTSGVALLLLCPARPELLEKRPQWGGGRRNYVTLSLEPLSTPESEALVQSLLPGEAVPQILRQGITRKAEGNPFYVEEIVRMLVDRGILVTLAPANAATVTQWQLAPEWVGSPEVLDPVIPDTVQGVLAARLDLLNSDERDVLQHAAVVGRYFWSGILRGLHPHVGATLDATLRALQAKDLIAESDRQEVTLAPPGEPAYSFTHALTREVTYAAIPRTRRAHEHQRVAAWLESLAQGREAEFADIIAQHYRQYYVQANLARARSSLHRRAVRDRVAYYLTLAGDQAVARHAAHKAERYYTETMSLLADDALTEDVPQRVLLFVKRGDAYWMQMRGDEAWADYREALHLWTEYQVPPVIAPTAAEASTATTPPAPPTAEAEPARPLAEARLTLQHEAAVGVADIPASVATAEIAVPDRAAEARLLGGNALPVAVEWPSIGLRLYCQLVKLPTRSRTLFQQPPDHEDLLPYLRDGLRLAEELGQLATLEGAQLLTAKSFFWWSWGEQRTEHELLDALRSAREAVRIADALDDPVVASEALDALGNMQEITADLRGSLESQERRLHWARRLDDTAELVDIHAEVCTACTLVGDFRRGMSEGQRALELAEDADANPLRARALRSLVLCSFESDQWREVMALGTRLLAVSSAGDVEHSHHQRGTLLACAIASARVGERELSDRFAERVGMVSDRSPSLFIEVFKARLALARGALKEARQLLLAALDARSGRVSLPVLLAELAELGARSGDRDLYDRFGAQALELGWRSGSRKALATATRARGIVAVTDGRWDDAESDLHGSLSRYEELGLPWEEARTRYALAGLYRRREDAGDADKARAELEQALTLFEALGAVRDVARARAALSGGDVRLP